MMEEESESNFAYAQESNPEYTQQSNLDEYAQHLSPEHPQQYTSFSELVQESEARLENECLSLENEINVKTKSAEDIKKQNRILAEDISKLKSEIGHKTVKVNNEIFCSESCSAKISSVLMEKYEELGKHFSSLNVSLPQNCINRLMQLRAYLASCDKRDQESREWLEQQYSKVFQYAEQLFNKLENIKEKEKTQFDETLAHLKTEMKIRRQNKTDKKAKLQEVKSKNREKLLILSLMEPQNNELTNKHERLLNGLEKEKMTIKAIIDELSSSLKVEQDKNEELKANTAASEKLINQTNNEIIDAENKIAAFENQLKGLLSEEEELTKNCNIEMETQNKLTLENESMAERLSELQTIDKENDDLKQKKICLSNVNNDYKQKLAGLDQVETSCHKGIKELHNSIEKKEIERMNNISKIQSREDQLIQSQAESEHEACEHNRLSLELDKPEAELKRQEETLNKNLEFLTEQLSISSEDRRLMETIVANFKIELELVKKVFEEGDAKLFNFREFSERIKHHRNVERAVLNEMLKKAKEDVEKAEKYSQLNTKQKEQIGERKTLHEKQKEIFAENIQKLEEDFAKQIELKNKSIEEIRVKYDKEYRNKEQHKNGALVELKENKARLSELQAQQQLIENTIEKKKYKLVKCGKLMRKLGSTLVAIASSQVSAQSSNVFNTPQLPKTDHKPRVPSPAGSSSSGLTFNPDDVNSVKRRKVNFGPSQNIMKKPNLPQRYTAPKKSTKYEEKMDDWGFFSK